MRASATDAGTDDAASVGSATKHAVEGAVGEHEAEAVRLSRLIHGTPELAFEEHQAAGWLSHLLQRHGFDVRSGVAGLPTAMVARVGTGQLTVGLCAEYDALPKIGHACGHNIISGAAALAAMALAPHAERLGITLKVFGTPAEERGGGKVIMLRAGVFEGVHAALMVHPTPHDLVRPTIAALCTLDVEFAGQTPPAMSPEDGHDAAAAATLLQVAVGLLRQSIRSTDRVSGIVRSAGHSPNVLPDQALLSYALRSADDERLSQLVEQFGRCAEGAALATGTQVSISEPHPRYAALRHHEALGQLYQTNAERLGRRFAPVGAADSERNASTDFGNLSAVIPAAIHPLIGVDAEGASNHQEQFAAHCGLASGDRAVRDAGLALAWTIVDLATDPELRRDLVEHARKCE
jgi:amidohydrolase